MLKMRRTFLTSSSASLFALGASIVAGFCGSALARDPLSMIPPDVAGVIAFRDLDGSCKKLTQFIKTAHADFSGIDVSFLEDFADFEAGAWDTSKPVVFILTQPSFDLLTEEEFGETTAILAFTPKNPRQYAPPAGGRDGAVRRIEQAGRNYYVTMRDGVVFFGGKRKVMRVLRDVTPAESLAATLDNPQQALYARSDLFIHLPLAGWRERLNVLTLLAGNMMRLGMSTGDDAALMESGKLVLDWFTGAARSVVDQMQSLTLSADFDGETFRIAHYHTFRAGGSVCDYLKQVKRSGADLWAVLPDRPFYLLAAFDWHCAADAAISVRFQDYVLNSESVAGRLSPELRKSILEKNAACAEQTLGSYLMLSSPRGRLQPVQILGGYYMQDAREGLQQLRYVQENSTEAFAGFMGGNYAGKFERRSRDGQDYYEMKLESSQMSPRVRQQMDALYGESLRIQDAAIGEHFVLYTMSGDEKLLSGVVHAHAQGQNIRRDPRIGEIVGCLPPDPHGLIVLDLGRLLNAAPHVVRVSVEMGGSKDDSVEPADDSAAPDDSDQTPHGGPLVGWACVVRPTSLSGHLAISAKDAMEISRIAKKVGRELPGKIRRAPNSATEPRPRR